MSDIFCLDKFCTSIWEDRAARMLVTISGVKWGETFTAMLFFMTFLLLMVLTCD